MAKKRDDIREKIKKISGSKASDWQERSRYMRENQKWLDYSARIALRIDAQLENHPELTQAALAKALKVPKQQVSRILRGDQNLTLKTIAQISEVIGFELISFPNYKDSYIQLNATMPINSPARVIPITHLQEAKASYTVNQTITHG